MQALWGEPWTARSVFSIETKSCLFEEMSPISGYLPSNARWRSEGKARSREDEMVVPPRYLFLGIYCIIAFETAMRQQNFAKQNWTEKDNNKEIKAGPPLIWVFGHFWLFCTMV